MMGQSYHPPSIFKGLTRGENIRILRNCTKQQNYTDTMDFLTKRFAERKIPSRFVNIPIVLHVNRDQYLHDKLPSKDQTNIPFVCL